jgi:hypothetical protein
MAEINESRMGHASSPKKTLPPFLKPLSDQHNLELWLDIQANQWRTRILFCR